MGECGELSKMRRIKVKVKGVTIDYFPFPLSRSDSFPIFNSQFSKLIDW